MHRICLSEEVLSEYIGGVLSSKERDSVEEHLSRCSRCRKMVSDVHTVLKKSSAGKIRAKLRGWLKRNFWLIGSFLAFVFSFFLSGYFFQLLTAAALMGAKWVFDSRTSKTLIMVYEAWKKGDKEGTEELLSRFKTR
ncbi:MAG: zf-HC2 domain-containing protein [Candidatus Tantalella remota]|nr:zf-HC2 domain-containing protein [Candidatus Tantalella remota]